LLKGRKEGIIYKVDIIDYSVDVVCLGGQGSRGRKGKGRKVRRRKEGREEGKRREIKNWGRKGKWRKNGLNNLVFEQNGVGR
jgi:hypothetical protein